MTSFISKTFSFTGHHLPETVCAVLATSRTLMNSSIVPVTLSDDETWDILCSDFHKEKQLLKIFSLHSDTMQFTQKFRIHHTKAFTLFIRSVLQDLIDGKRYFSRTLQHLDLVCDAIPVVCGKLSNIHSISFESCRMESFGDVEFELICQHFTLLKTLNLHGKKFITDAGLEHICHLRLLEVLDLGDLPDITALPFLKHTPKLQKINLRQCTALAETAFDDEGCAGLVLPALEEINVEFCKNLTSHSYDKIQQLAPNLTTLCCTHVTEDAFLNSISAMKKLKTLHFADLLQQGNSLTTTAMEALSNNLKYLEALQLVIVGNNLSLNNSHLLALSQSVGPLRSLSIDVRVDDVFDDEGFGYLTSLKCLETLEIIYHPTPNSSSVFTGDMGSEKRFPNTLKEVKFQRCDSLSNAGLASILKGLGQLEKLVLRYCHLITSEGLHSALEGTSSVTSSSSSSSSSSSRLIEIDLTGCIGFADLRFLSGLTSLQKIVLNRINSFNFPAMRETGTGFDCLPTSAPLRELYIGPGSAIEDQDLAALPVNAMRTLQRVGLGGCRQLTSKTLSGTIAPSMPNLTWLNIRDCNDEAFTLVDIIHMVDNLKYLKKCIVSECNIVELNADVGMKRKYGSLLMFFDPSSS